MMTVLDFRMIYRLTDRNLRRGVRRSQSMESVQETETMENGAEETTQAAQ